MKRPKQLTAREVLIDLFGGADFDHEIIDPAGAADLVLERLADAGFAIVPAPWPGMPSL
jgi:hypothetical protein